MTSDPHKSQEIRHAGLPLEEAEGVVILLHGRGGSAEDILSLAKEMDHPRLAYLAPEAAGHTWYPNSFLAPVTQNEPWLSSALGKVRATLDLAVANGHREDRLAICGFSQGACLTAEFVARNPARYAGVIAFTGGLIGPPDADLAHTGDLAGTPTLFASGDPDPHVPWSRVQRSAEVFAGMNAVVRLERYPGKPHTVSNGELDIARQMLQDAFPGR